MSKSYDLQTFRTIDAPGLEDYCFDKGLGALAFIGTDSAGVDRLVLHVGDTSMEKDIRVLYPLHLLEDDEDKLLKALAALNISWVAEAESKLRSFATDFFKGHPETADLELVFTGRYSLEYFRKVVEDVEARRLDH